MGTSVVVGLIILGLFLLIALVGIGIFLWILLYQHKRISSLEEKLECIQEKINGSKSPCVCSGTCVGGKVIDTNGVTLYETDEINDGKDILSDNRPRSRGKPRFTIKIKKENAYYHGAEANISQLISIAQNYYKDLSESDKTTVQADDVDIISTSPDDRYFRSIKRQSIFEGRPTSVLLYPSGKETHENGIFCYNTIGPKGGKLEISGVVLKIPENAITEPTRITLGVIWDEKLQPKLTSRQALLSPVVICQPSLKFKHAVKLSFPHCAVNISENWRLKLLMKEGDIGASSDWKAIDDDNVKRDITSSRITLELNHFTLYTCIGEGVEDKIAAKSVKLVAFTSRLEIGLPYKARIYCINDYKKEMGEVEDAEKQLKGKMADANVPLIIHDNGGNISVTSSYISENWNRIGNKTEEMDFELVWHALTPSCTFIFKPGNSTMKEIICEFESCQVTQKTKTAKLKVADHANADKQNKRTRSSQLTPIVDNPKEELIRSLSILLDPKAIALDTGDYRNLADKINCDVEEIKWIEHQPNPTEIVLHKFFSHDGKLEDLRQILIDINRPDAAELIDKFLQTKSCV